MKYRTVHLSERVRDLLEQAEHRRQLAYQLSFDQFQALEQIVQAWDKAAHSEVELHADAEHGD